MKKEVQDNTNKLEQVELSKAEMETLIKQLREENMGLQKSLDEQKDQNSEL